VTERIEGSERTDLSTMSVAQFRTELLTRRRMTGLAVAGGSVAFLAACGADDESATDTSSSPSASSSESSGSSGSASTAPSESASADGGAAGFTTTADIEVGGGTIFADEEVVVTQPTAGDFKCFSAVCTHQGCLVSSVEDGAIICSCHNSHFSIEDGQPESGPAGSPLESVDITVTGDQISLA
jgi:nitrite reductase/ring-hydroxylating ferredoxin subunit